MDEVLSKRIEIDTIPMPTADKEYQWVVPPNLNNFVMKTRLGSAFRIATRSGKVSQSNDPYGTIGIGIPYAVDRLKPPGDGSFIFYFASSTAGELMEIFMGLNN